MKPIFRGSTLYSATYEDIYYNPQEGLAESRFVFLEGVNLPSTIESLASAKLVETGFGTGLNFLLTAQLLEEIGWKKPFLYASIEGFPLSKELLEQVYQQNIFNPLETQTERLLSLYPENPKMGEVLTLPFTPNITLSLLFFPLEEALSHLPSSVNYWYLDGFNPKRNPQMWSTSLFNMIGASSAQGAILATFTASRLVKDGLDLAGFNWERVKGFDRKRHCLTAQKR